MASPAQMPRGGDTIKFEVGEPRIFALKFATGKSVASMYPGGRVMFTAIDDRKLFLSDEDASEFEHALAEQGIGPADFMRVTKVKHGGRGGGFSIRVERIEDENDAREPEPRRDARLEGQLEKSIEMARATGASSKSSALPAPARVPEAARVPIRTAPRSIHSNTTQEKTNGNETVCLPNGPTITPAAAQLCGAFMAAIDAMNEARSYSKRCGFGDIVFTSEDLRACALTVYIGQSKGGR